MLEQIFQMLSDAAVTIGVKYQIGVKQLESNSGEDLYPMIYLELPMLITETETTITFSITGYSLLKRVTQLKDEELSQISQAFDIARLYLSKLEAKGFRGSSYLTYSGVELALFSDDVNGIRFEFGTTITKIC